MRVSNIFPIGASSVIAAGAGSGVGAGVAIGVGAGVASAAGGVTFGDGDGLGVWARAPVETNQPASAIAPGNLRTFKHPSPSLGKTSCGNGFTAERSECVENLVPNF